MDFKTEGSEGGAYSPFNPQLDRQFPVSSLMLHDEDKESIVKGEIEPLEWISFFRNSPARNSEAEILMGRIFTEAVRAGQWMDIPEPQEDQNIGPISFEREGVNITVGPFPLEFRRAAQLLYEHGLAQRVTDEQGRNYLRPTEQLMRFFGQRIGFKQK